ncbi:MAG TPA: class I SAM-dependent methyltransferase [Salinivirgaceae bacterium]|mgnify:CR=1 FL=1|nr:class I SAM-dependent methyltransferase [Salinivirgaceae bacterium]
MENSFKSFMKLLIPKYQKLILEYKIDMKPRYGYGLKPHTLLYELINKNRNVYEQFLKEILIHKNTFQSIRSVEVEKDENQPSWNNGFLPGLDIISLYTILNHFKPQKYIEIGSGNSTKVARKSILENKLNTKIISIDPFPRATIDHLADEVIRQPLENIKDYQFIINELKENDILFIDNSHRCLPNSDATVCFLELLPYLKKGVIVHIHDIYLPYDYPQFMCDRFYSEQYVLAAFVLANPEKYKPIFPGIFISEDKELSNIISPIWEHPNTKNVEKHGGAFWIQIN